MSLRVLIADDQALLRAGFRLILSGEGDMEVVGEVANGEEAVKAAKALNPDVILMDVRMPKTDGLQATKAIASTRPTAPRVLVLTTYDLDEYVYEALDAGASGFVLKDTSPEDLVKAIRVVAAGDSLLSPSITRRLIEEFARRRSKPGSSDDRIARLTERESEVLVLIASGLSNQEIAGRLFVGESTIKTHVTRILDKLQARDRAQAVVIAYESGLMKPPVNGMRDV